MNGYFENELNVKVFYKPQNFMINNKKFLIGHGDGLGPGDKTYKLLKAFFASKICQWIFARIHPNFGVGIANAWSRKSRKANSTSDEVFHGEDKEDLILYCNEYIKKDDSIDYFVFGHRHLPLAINIGAKANYFNLGEWIKYNSYGVFDGKKFELKTYK
jgi:UDP-2,3-diacylglucosamine hydrolase